MPNRYSRDELIKIALSMAQLPNLDIHDIPNGVVQPDAYAIQWLQDILDFWYHMVPFSSTVTATPLNCTANVGTISLPSDFILDVRNGYLVQTIPGNTTSYKRVYRVPFQKFLNRVLYYQTTVNALYPHFYTILGETDLVPGISHTQTIQVTPVPSINTVGKLWYYKLPPKLQSNTIPDFPTDYVCEEYIRIRALEFVRIFEPGTAQKFCDKMVAGMKANGLMNEPEDDEIPFDELTFKGRGSNLYNSTYAWMGTI